MAVTLTTGYTRFGGVVGWVLQMYRDDLVRIQTEVTGDVAAINAAATTYQSGADRAVRLRESLSEVRTSLRPHWRGRAHSAFDSSVERLVQRAAAAETRMRRHHSALTRAASALQTARAGVDQVIAQFDEAARALIFLAAMSPPYFLPYLLWQARSIGTASATAARGHATQLGKVLAEVAAELNGGTVPGTATDAATYLRLRAEAGAVADRLGATAESLRGDGKYWFARVYQTVTTNELRMLDEGKYQYPEARMRQIIAFHDIYERNMQAWQAGNLDQVDPNWRVAFAAAEAENGGTWYKPRSTEILHALLPSVEAHIRFDLPRAIADVYMQEHGTNPTVSLTQYRPDFEAMNPVFAVALEQIRPEIEGQLVGIDPGNWDWGADTGFKALYFDIPVEREMTWDKAEAIVSGRQQGVGWDQMQQRLENTMDARHPIASHWAFEVGGGMAYDALISDRIRDYSWGPWR